MTDHPIIFSAPMVRALLAGRKTQTRRLATSPLRRCEVGDRLYVREAWRVERVFDGMAPRDLYDWFPPEYSASTMGRMDAFTGRARAAMHMPRWASRLTLTVTDVRVQRLCEISEADARAEGLASIPDPQQAFRDLWNILHTKPGETWADNPEIVALTFTVEQRNIDAVRP